MSPLPECVCRRHLEPALTLNASWTVSRVRAGRHTTDKATTYSRGSISPLSPWDMDAWESALAATPVPRQSSSCQALFSPEVAQQELRPRSVGSTCGEQGGATGQGSIPWSHPTNVCRGAWGDPGPCQLNSTSRERRKRAGAKGARDILHITAEQCRL